MLGSGWGKVGLERRLSNAVSKMSGLAKREIRLIAKVKDFYKMESSA